MAGSQGSSQRGSNSGTETREQDDTMTREKAARKGGEAVSQDREHMAEIGKKGGEAFPRRSRLPGQR